MPKITLDEAKEAFENSRRSSKALKYDKIYSRKPKFMIDEDDERGSRYLKPNGTKTYDFQGVDDGKIIMYKSKIEKLKETIKDIQYKESLLKKKLKKSLLKKKLKSIRKRLKQRWKKQVLNIKTI